MHRFHSCLALLFSILVTACIGDPNCPEGSSWSAGANECVCDEGRARHRLSFRCLPLGDWVDGGLHVDDAGPPEGGTSDLDGGADDGGGGSDGGTVDGGTDATIDRCTACDAPPAHGEASCDEGACGVSCEPGFEAVAVGDTLRCSAFGGAYVRRGDGTCADENPLTGDCTCGGFTAREIRWRIDRLDPHVHAMLGLCEASTTPESGSYGGAYVIEEEPSRRCLEPNGDTGECTCPERFAPSRSWLGRNDIDRRTRIVFCLAATPEPGATIASAYTEVRCEGATSCATGEDCTCPTGTRAVEVASGVQRAGDGECATRSVICVAD
ncbi:hypothetical protein [Sandaracinus amylolyticus]|uniref:hypothetical protein n=1 Tax=Sandaracinus amylolyticus TaxID=927083 RepID=UPI001F4765C7|nr:hypothetical protein [Sandaracinus amylolyticus]UJR85037.1 Hypothetical protein I5071_71160 [Sandaracinus amylolyticus]